MKMLVAELKTAPTPNNMVPSVHSLKSCDFCLDCSNSNACGYGAYCFLTGNYDVGCKCRTGYRGRTQIGKQARCIRN